MEVGWEEDWRTYEEIIQAVTVDITAGEAVAEIGSDLGGAGQPSFLQGRLHYLVSSHVVQVGEV